MIDCSDEQIRTSTSVKVTVRELYDMVYVKKWSDSTIASHLGLSAKTIRNYRRKCQFDTTFKTGLMDLPLHEVKKMVARGATDLEIVERFNTTMTAFQSFRRRFSLSTNPVWPPDRKDLIEMALTEYYNYEIASAYGVSEQTVLSTMIKMSVIPFTGTKSAKLLRKTPPTDPDDQDTLQDAAIKFLGHRVSYSDKLGYTLDGEYISVQSLMDMIGYRKDKLWA